MVFQHHKPLSTMYGDNYRYGTSLYSPSLNDFERSYRTSLSKTHVRSDRGDLGMYTFAGSNIHGGTPAAERIQGTKVRGYNPDLYAPLNTGEYGKGYYDHLRASTPPPRARSSKMSDLYEPLNPTEYHPHYYDHLRASSPEPRARKGPIPYYDLQESPYNTRPYKMTSDYTYDGTKKTSSADYSYDFYSHDDSGKKTTTKKTTTTEYWVPLTTHIYHTPYHTYFYRATPFSSYTYRTADDLYNYNFLDDYKRYSKTTTTTSKNVDALDLSVSKSYEKSDYSHYSQKCQEIQSQLNEVNKWILDAETKLKSEVVSTRSKIQSELAEVTSILDETAKYSDDLHSVIRKQAKQISSLNKEYNDVNRNLVDIADVLERSRSRCQTLQSELSSVQSVIETKTHRY
ncbi:unnamed protein product [Larinioides sclopetarius]|uniref:Paramyosin n=1 Tax=Larinioides sclopetarius TaxID=280406 RepID=A0AAV2AQX5_9ARAC